MMLNGRRRRQRASIGYRRNDSATSDDADEDGSCFPRISSRTGGYESSVASHLVSSASDLGSFSSCEEEDERTVKADNTTTATSHELFMFRFPAANQRGPAPGVSNQDRRGAKAQRGGRRMPNTQPAHQRSFVSSTPSRSTKDSSKDGRASNHSTKSSGDENRGGGRMFLRNLVSNHQGFRVARNNTEATVDADIVSDDSRSPHLPRFVLPDDDDDDGDDDTEVPHQPASPWRVTYTTTSNSSASKQTNLLALDNSTMEHQNSDGYEVLSHPNHKTMTIVHSSLTKHFGSSSACPRRSQQDRKQRILVDSDLVDPDDLHSSSSSNSSSFSQLLMTDGDLMKNQQRFGTGVIRLTTDSLKEHEEHLQHNEDGMVTNKNKKQPPHTRRKHRFAFWRRTKCDEVDPAVQTVDETEKRRIEQKRQEYLRLQRQREFGSVTKEQRDSIFDSLVDNKSRATQSTVSSAASHVTPRCHGCPTTGAMVDTVSFWSD